MMAHGPDCSQWDDAVDWALMEKFDYGDVPDEDFVMTTWHERENLEELMFYARCCAGFDDQEFENLVILDIDCSGRGAKLTALYLSNH
jgi:hypothetical protein